MDGQQPQTTDAPVTPVANVRSLDAETLQRLAHLETHGDPVLSLYFDLDPERFPTPSSHETELESLLDQARRQGADREIRRIRALLAADPMSGGGTHGLAIFCSAPTDTLEIVRLAHAVEPLAVVDSIPWLEPLAALLAPGDWAVVILSRRAARLLRGGPDGLAEFAVLEDDVYRRHAQGGWSQARYQRGIEEQVAAHVRRVAEVLFVAHQHRPFGHLAIVCADELRPVIKDSLHPELRAVLAGTIDVDLERASVSDIARRVAPLVQRIDSDRELALIASLEHALGTNGPAAAGLADVLSALEQERVETLFVPERPHLKAGLCPTCDRLSVDGGVTCPLDGQPLADVDAVEYAIERAIRQDAQIIVSHTSPAWLDQHGEIAAVLRW